MDFTSLNQADFQQIKWELVDFKKLSKSSTFGLGYFDWEQLSQGNYAKRIYSAIDWSSESIPSEVAKYLDWSLINFSKFDPKNLSDVNDFDFDTLGKNNKKFKWNELDYSKLNAESLKDIDWTQVDFKKAG